MISKNIRDRISNRWEGTTPGFHLRVLQNGQIIADERFGITYLIYDWASLTKMIFTLTLVMKCVEDGNLHEEDLVGKFLPELKNNKELKIKHLLSHTANLPASIHFWDKKPVDTSDIERVWRQEVLSLKMLPTERSSYTELDFQVLGYVLEFILGKSILTHWKNISNSMGLNKTFFNPLHSPVMRTDCIAPTEICPLRGKRIQGEVHHPDVWLNGGVGWLSGLFGSMDDFSIWATGLRSTFYGSNHWIIKPETLQRFTHRIAGNSSLGFMMPKIGRRDGQKYYLSCGELFGPRSIGHTGFTGPMFWFDPDRDLLVLILTNRTFPNAKNETWFNFRGVLHDEIVRVLDVNDKIKTKEYFNEKN